MRYNVILADPPWRYSFSRSRSRRVENYYPTMTTAEICALDVAALAADDAVIFLWTTAPKLIDGLRVLEAWGFRYVTGAVWDKRQIGMGYYFRGQHEHLLIGVRGKPGTPEPAARVASIIKAKRGRHSAKPAIVHEIIERMYPDARRLELFARAPRDQWETWGNEVESAVQIPMLAGAG